MRSAQPLDGAATAGDALLRQRMHLFFDPDDDRSPPVVRLRAAKGLAASEKRAVKLYAGWATQRPECFVAAG